MLKKEICMKCLGKSDKKGWDAYDDLRWKVGVVDCCLFKMGKIEQILVVNQKPPDECFFILEHILEEKK